eukprot:5814704-Pleurochrysis_carterae.AAC.1
MQLRQRPDEYILSLEAPNVPTEQISAVYECGLLHVSWPAVVDGDVFVLFKRSVKLPFDAAVESNDVDLVHKHRALVMTIPKRSGQERIVSLWLPRRKYKIRSCTSLSRISSSKMFAATSSLPNQWAPELCCSESCRGSPQKGSSDRVSLISRLSLGSNHMMSRMSGKLLSPRV